MTKKDVTHSKSGKKHSSPTKQKKKKTTVIPVPGKPIRKSDLAKASGIKKPRRNRSGTVALREIVKYQTRGRFATDLLSATKPLYREIKAIIAEHSEFVTNLSADAMEVIHIAVEDELRKQLEDANMIAVACKRNTIVPKDMQLANDVRLNHPERVPDGYRCSQKYVNPARRIQYMAEANGARDATKRRKSSASAKNAKRETSTVFMHGRAVSPHHAKRTAQTFDTTTTTITQPLDATEGDTAASGDGHDKEDDDDDTYKTLQETTLSGDY